MRRVLIIFLMFVPLLACADGGAVKLLDKAVAQIKADTGVQMDFEYSLYNANGERSVAEKGVFYADCSLEAKDKERFALLLEHLKIWCDGTRQWNYSGQTDEIYITDAESEEAQNLSPLHIMQLYKGGYKSSLSAEEAVNVVTLLPTDDNGEFGKVVLYIDKATLQPLKMQLDMGDNGCINIEIKKYKGGCKFADEIFVCPVNDYPNAEVIDMR